jgi:hypothetical protein
MLVSLLVVAALTLVMACSEELAPQPFPEPPTATAKAPAATVAESTAAAPKEGAPTAAPAQAQGADDPSTQMLQEAVIFKKMFLDFPNPGPTGPMSDNYAAAGNAPLSGSTELIAQEQACLEELAKEDPHVAPWFKTMAPSEHADSARTHLVPCANFTGDFTSDNNQVYAHTTRVSLGGTIYAAVTGTPQQLFAYGGGNGSLVRPGLNQGHFIALLDARTLEIKWKTVLDNWNVSGQWTVLSAVNYPANGYLYVSYGQRLAKIDPATGEVLIDIALPHNENAPALGLNYETTVMALDGTLITKSQTRPNTTESDPNSPPCTEQGFNAMFNCKGEQPISDVVAVDPDTLEVLDWITLPEQAGGRNPATVYDGKHYTYMTGLEHVLRIEWDPETKKLSFDENWFPAYRDPGQAAGAAPCILGDWVVLNSNAGPAQVPASIVAVHQGDPNNIHRIEAIPLGDSPVSIWPAKVACDTDNNMIFAYDFGPGQLVGLKLDPETGDLSVAWGPVDQRSLGFATLLGPADQRVLLGSNVKATDRQQLQDVTYTEQFVWRDALTGDVLARSQYIDAMTQGNLPTPGYGGIVYMLQAYGDITAMQVRPGG